MSWGHSNLSWGDDHEASVLEGLAAAELLYSPTEASILYYEAAGLRREEGDAPGAARDEGLAVIAALEDGSTTLATSSDYTGSNRAAPERLPSASPPHVSPEELEEINRQFSLAGEAAVEDREWQPGAPALVANVELQRLIGALRTEIIQRATNGSMRPRVAISIGRSTAEFIDNMKNANSRAEQDGYIAQYRRELNLSITLSDVVFFGLVGAVIAAAIAFSGFAAAPLTVAYAAAGGAVMGGLFPIARALEQPGFHNAEGLIDEAKRCYPR